MLGIRARAIDRINLCDQTNQPFPPFAGPNTVTFRTLRGFGAFRQIASFFAHAKCPFKEELLLFLTVETVAFAELVVLTIFPYHGNKVA